MKKPLNRFYGVAISVIRFVWKIVYPYQVEGLEHLPQERALLCPNHASNLDPIYVAVALPNNYRLHFMGKEELFRNPALNWLLRKLGAFPVNRGGNDIQAVKTSIQVLKEDDNLLIFPEGTTIRNGIGSVDGLPPHAKSGAAMIAIRTGAKPSFTFIKRLFSSSSLSAIRMVSSPYLRLLIFLPAILIPACASSSPVFLMMYSAYKLNKQGDNIQP